jgi:hypothetical protein
MTSYKKVVQKIPGIISNPTRGQLVRDPVIAGSAGGCGWVADYDWDYSFARQDDPQNGDTLTDPAALGNGQFVKTSDTISFAGGGFDFSAATVRGSYDQVPASFASAIWDSAAAGQHFAILLYVRIPVESDWTASGTGPLFGFNSFDIGWIGMTVSGGTKVLRAAINYGSSGSAALLDITPKSADYGQLMQIMLVKNASGIALQTRTAAGGIQTSSASALADLSTDFSAETGEFGLGSGWAADVSARNDINFRTYRRVLSNLRLDARDWTDVANDDWTRVQARIAASAAANGGTSLIFV